MVEHGHQRVQHQVPALARVEQPLRGLPQLGRVATPEPVYVSDTSAIPSKDQSSIASQPVSVADGSNNPQAIVKPE